MNNDARQERTVYADWLLSRVAELAALEVPQGFSQEGGRWKQLRSVDRMLVAAATAYEQGRITRHDLDRAGLLYLTTIREEHAKFRASRTRAA